MGTIMTLEGQGFTTSEAEEGAGGLIATEDVYFASQAFNIGNGATYILHFTLGVNATRKDMYAKVQAKLEGGGMVEVFEDPILIAGLPGGLFNVLNSATGQIATPNVIASADPGVDVAGVSLVQQHIGASQPAVLGPTYFNTRSHDYLIQVTNLSGGAARGSLEVTWSEVS